MRVGRKRREEFGKGGEGNGGGEVDRKGAESRMEVLNRSNHERGERRKG